MNQERSRSAKHENPTREQHRKKGPQEASGRIWRSWRGDRHRGFLPSSTIFDKSKMAAPTGVDLFKKSEVFEKFSETRLLRII